MSRITRTGRSQQEHGSLSLILGDAGIIKRKWLGSFDILVTTREERAGVGSAQKAQAEITWRKGKRGCSGSLSLTSWI